MCSSKLSAAGQQRQGQSPTACLAAALLVLFAVLQGSAAAARRIDLQLAWHVAESRCGCFDNQATLAACLETSGTAAKAGATSATTTVQASSTRRSVCMALGGRGTATGSI
jgi:hypothetical protein